MAGLGVLAMGLEGNRMLTGAVATAIARHHSPQASMLQNRSIHFHPKTVETVQQALDAAGVPGEWSSRFRMVFDTPPIADKYLLRSDQWLWWLVYFLIVRAVRLTDGDSQETGAS